MIEEMLKATGFVKRERGTVNVINEWPDIASPSGRSPRPAPRSPPSGQSASFCDALRR